MERRLLILAQAEHRLGGVPVWMSRVVPFLAEQGWRVCLGLVSSGNGSTERFVLCHPGLRAFACDVSSRTGTRQGRRRAILRAIRDCRPDLVLVIDVADAYEILLEMRFRRESDARLAMALHGIHPGYIEDQARMCAELDAVICTNRLTARLSSELGGMPPQRVYYAPYGINDELPALRSRSKLDHLRIGWVGRLESTQKRCLDALGIIRHLRSAGVSAELLVAGDGPMRSQVEDIALDASLLNVVHVLGELTPERVDAAIYRRIDLLLITSMWETGPLVAWEAMSRGLPVVSSRFLGSGLEKALVDGENASLFEIGDFEGATHALQRMTNVAVRSAIGAGGKALVTRRYSMNVSNRAWAEALALVVQGGPSGRGWQEPVGEAPAGRLDSWLGAGLGETVRAVAVRAFRRLPSARTWPFVLGSGEAGAEFWKRVAALDGSILPARVIGELETLER